MKFLHKEKISFQDFLENFISGDCREPLKKESIEVYANEPHDLYYAQSIVFMILEVQLRFCSPPKKN